MDQHFWTAPPEKNMPLLMALLGVWNRNFLDCPTHLIASYASRLFHFARFLQQLDMESNGKSTHVDGSAVSVGTGPIVWGGLGIEGQHAYFQLLHQGQHRVPVDFIGVETEDTPLPLAAEHHRVALLNLRAQAQALALGRDEPATVAELRANGLSEERINELLPHRTFRGNVPSTTFWLSELNPRTLGAMVALYEHKVFCQAALWGIHAYDQWGVELGKTMAKAMEAAAESRHTGQCFFINPPLALAMPRRPAAAPDKDQPLINDIRLLGRLLGDVIREHEGVAIYELIEQIRQLSVAYRRQADHAADRSSRSCSRG